MNALLPHDLSPWGMFLGANLVVKAVLIGLFIASVVTWTVWLAKSLELIVAKRGIGRAIDQIAALRTLAEPGAMRGPAAQFLRAAIAEVQLSPGLAKDGIKERIASRLERIEAAERQRIARGIGVLGTIGATAPFVGLFGTVWGIMNSFVGISQAQTTNLAVVAPGIAEALLATALGLVAAIPAVVMYNLFARWVATYRLQVADAAAEVERLASRDCDRKAPALAKAAE